MREISPILWCVSSVSLALAGLRVVDEVGRAGSDAPIGEGLAAGVRDVGAVLAEHFPRADDDVNELPDRLIVV